MGNRLKEYNFPLNAYKGLFAVFIMVNHLGLNIVNFADVNTINYLIVDAFFVISGYLLMVGIDGKRKKVSIKDYLLKRMKRIYPQYLFGIVSVLFLIALRPYVWNERGLTLLSVFEELFMLQQAALSVNLLNGPDWYISAWIFSTLVWLIVYKWGGMKGVVGVATMTFLEYTIWVVNNGYMSGIVRPFLLLGGLTRAICVMGVGMLTHCWCTIIYEKVDDSSTLLMRFTKSGNFLEIILVVLFLITLKLSTAFPAIDIILLLIIALLITLSNVDTFFNRCLKSKWIQCLGNWSMYLYLSHVPADLVHRYLLEGFGGRFGKLCVVFFFMIASKYIPNMLIMILKKQHFCRITNNKI